MRVAAPAVLGLALPASLRAQQRLLLNPLEYPAGMAARFDPSHPAAQGTPFSAVSAAGGGMINLVTGAPGTRNGTPSYGIKGIVGPVTSFPGNTDNSQFTFSNTTFSSAVMAGVVVPPASAANNSYIVNNAAAGSYGLSISNATSQFANVVIANVSVASAILMAVGIPYFVVASVKSGSQVIVVMRLDTGAIQTFTAATVQAATAGDGSMYVGNRGTNTRQLGGALSACMFTGNCFLSLQQLLAWCADGPWNYWFQRPEEILVGLSSAISPRYRLLLGVGQ